MRGWCTTVFLIVFCFYLSDGKSHTKEVDYEVQVSVYKCYWQDRCRYRWWWWWWCIWERYEHCYWTYETQTRSRTVCVDGWTGSNCDIPICKRCTPGYSCVAPDKCECLSSGGACTSVPCSSQLSCYPGTCRGGSCACPSPFRGTDCTDITMPPSIESCSVTIQDAGKVLATGQCAYQNQEPTDIMVNSLNWKDIFMNVEVRAISSWETPSSAGLAHIKFPVKLGVANSGFKIYRENTLVNLKTCDITPSSAMDYYKCTQTEKDAPLDLAHGTRITISAYASLGGTKEGSRMEGNDNSYFAKANFKGAEAWRNVTFKVDTKPPVHCYTVDCDYFPVQMERDITSDPEIQLSFTGWDDKDSGIESFRVQVFLMQLSSDDFFEPVGKPFMDRILKPNDPDFNSFVFNCKKPGVHSIEITVFDGANNTARARNIFIYTGAGKLRTNPDKPIRISNTRFNNRTGEYWLTDEAFHRREKTLKISWEGYFVSEARFSNEWSQPARPWEGEGIDDNPNQREGVGIGRRTIFGMKEFQDGITNYSLSYYVDEHEGGISENYTEYEDFSSTTLDHDLDIGYSKEGLTIGIKLSALDISGGKKEERFKVRIDTSAPTLTNWTLLRNDPDVYTTRVAILLKDEQSGVDAIKFKLLQVLDGTNNLEIKTGEAEIIKRSPPPLTHAKVSKRETFEGPCKKGDGDCYCTPYRTCFSLIQFINIDHCWIDRQVKANSKIFIEFEAFNEAGLVTPPEKIELKNLEDLQCRPTFVLTAAQITAVVIGGLILMTLLSGVLALLVRIYIFKKPPPVAISNFRNRIRGEREETNELYISGDDDPRAKPKSSYAKSEGGARVKVVDETSKINSIQEDDVKVTEEIAKGPLMIISKGFFNDGTTKLPVAIKSLKNGSSQKAMAAMNSKAECLATLPSHENVIKVFGLINSDRGQMIVMEYCETTLKAWLGKISDVSPDLLDDMLSFAVNIARAVEHLHKNEVIHKRLAIRNVLLARQFNQWVAKLIGFGSKKDDDEDNASVPIKWLAPETLSTIGKKCPTYSEKSDSWSYGITLWEMFTLGKKQPYPDLGSSEAKSKIISGAIMDCPDECPPDLYEKVMLPCWARNPKERPNFMSILRLVENFKKGEDGGQTGYYASDEQDRSKKATDQSQAYYTDGS